MRTESYFRPATLAEARRLAAEHPGARYIAGGTDLMVRLRDGRARPPALISLRHIEDVPELDGIASRGGEITVGALTPVADLAAHPAIAEAHPVLAQAARALGSVQIRNVATVGGNLCNASPCADLAPPLLALEARVCIEGDAGRRELPLEEFFLAPGETRLAVGEVLTAVRIPSRPGARGIFFKHGRVAMDLSLVSVAVVLELDGGRCARAGIAAGSVAPKPLRLRKVEALLDGKTVTGELIAEARAVARAEVAPITDLRTTADYRRHLVGVLVGRALIALTGGL